MYYSAEITRHEQLRQTKAFTHNSTVQYGWESCTIGREVAQSEGCGRLPLQFQAALNSK